MFGNLVQFGEIRARFIMTGDTIERGSMIYTALTSTYVHSNVRLGHIVRAFRNETGGIEALSMNPDIMIPLFTAVNDEEFAAATAKFA